MKPVIFFKSNLEFLSKCIDGISLAYAFDKKTNFHIIEAWP